MKCEVTSSSTHGILINKKISSQSFKEICSGEPKKVNLGYNNDWGILKIENNTLMPYPQSCGDFPPRKSDYNPNGFSQCIYGTHSTMSYDWEVLSKFFSMHNIEPNWLNCNYTWGWYDEDLGRWTGCMGKV